MVQRPRSLPRARLDPEPARRGARRRRPRAALPPRLRLEPDEDDAGGGHRVDDGQPLRGARADGRGRAALPLRAPRHRAAGRTRSSRSSRTASSATRARRSSAPTTRPRSRRCSRRRGACSPRTGRTPGSSSSSRRRRRSACSARSRSTTRACAREVGYVYDQAAPIGDVVLGAPSAQRAQVTFHGRAAHAGMYPEEGRSAIAAAARAIARCGSGGSTRRRPRTSA